MRPGQLLLVEAEIYGLVSGPSCPESQFDCGSVSRGPCQEPVRQMLFTLFSNEDISEGQVLIDVDDFIEGGKEPHRKGMEGFYAKYHCGKSIDLRLVVQEGTLFAGRLPRHCVHG